MNEKEKMIAEEIYDPGDRDLRNDREKSYSLVIEINKVDIKDKEEKKRLYNQLFGKVGKYLNIIPNFHCDYGYNISWGDNCFANAGLVILDCAKVTIGNNVLIGPNVNIVTAGHPLCYEERNTGKEFAKEIVIKDNVWLGAGVTINPGVTIGMGSVIGSGSTVTKNIPSGVIAVGTPAKILREINESDRMFTSI